MTEKMDFETDRRIVKVMGNVPTTAFGIQFKSKFEAQWSKYLEMLVMGSDTDPIDRWNYEPKTFFFPDQKKAPVQYTPDFLITVCWGDLSNHYWQELKGWLDSQTISKFQKMLKYYPDEKFELVMQKIPKKGNAAMRYRKLLGRVNNDKNFNITRIIDGGKILRQAKGII